MHYKQSCLSSKMHIWLRIWGWWTGRRYSKLRPVCLLLGQHKYVSWTSTSHPSSDSWSFVKKKGGIRYCQPPWRERKTSSANRRRLTFFWKMRNSLGKSPFFITEANTRWMSKTNSIPLLAATSHVFRMFFCCSLSVLGDTHNNLYFWHPLIFFIGNYLELR